ncbi:MAG: putative toxin-antitoxin system toxin component, PIN family [Gammaproteobacteria bacterium]|nr:putative toxin-antitoxin system toxin component, PIN family [Gammaproteobacteria bacterium]
MRVVLDCNVLVSAARVDGTCREVINRVVLAHEIVLSKPILSEYKAVAERRSQRPFREALTFVISEIERLAVVVEPVNVVFGIRDPDDEVYLATAEAGGATLITGNIRDFTEARYGSVEVWSPRTFLDRTN